MLKKVIQLNEEDYSTLKTLGSIIKGGVTYTYSPSDTLYIVETDEVPEATHANTADYADQAGQANLVSWTNITSKPSNIYNVQSDWDESDSDDAAYILNKPFIPKVAEDVAALPDYSKMYLTFEITQAGTLGIQMKNANAPTVTVYYSTNNGRTWSSKTSSTNEQLFGTFAVGDKILVKGNNTKYSNGNASKCVRFIGTARTNVYGNIMSLLYGDNFVGQTTLESTYTFYALFHTYGSTGENVVLLTSIENLILPSTTLTTRCYGLMFYGQPLITKSCQLPATNLADYCYYEMFGYCTSLLESSTLYATTLTSSCYSCMFTGCTNLNYIKCLATNISALNCTLNWVTDVANTGVFIKADNMTSWTTGTSGIPTGWTVYTESEYKEAKKYEIPTSLSQLSDNTTHRLVTDTEKTTWNGKSKVTTITIIKNQQDEWELQNISSFSALVNTIQNSDSVILDYDADGFAHMYFDKVLLYAGTYLFTGTLFFGGASQLNCFAFSEGADDAIVIEDITSPIPSDSDVVHIANEETITGAKTFSDAVRLNGVASSVDSGSRLLFTSNGVLKGCVSANTSGGLNLRNGNGDALYLLNNTLYNRLRAGTVLGTIGNPFGTLHTNGTINKYIDGTSEYTLTLPSITGTLATENFTVAKIGSTNPAGTGGYLKIKLNEPTTTMSSIYINLYSSYEHYEYIISGYNYGNTKMWHMPKVTLRSSNKSSKIIYFGYDGDNDLWVAIPHYAHSNVVVSEAANSYLTKTPIKDVTFTWGLSTDTSQWTGTIQSEVTVYPLADLGDLQEIVGDINAVLLLVNYGNDESSSD